MTFEEHLEHSRGKDGLLQIDTARKTRQADVEKMLDEDPVARRAAAAKIVDSEHTTWRKREKANLSKAVGYAALSPELEAAADVKVQLGEARAIEYISMNGERIRLRKDMREKIHRGEQRAYVNEMDHWDQTLEGLEGGETIEEALRRLYP